MVIGPRPLSEFLAARPPRRPPPPDHFTCWDCQDTGRISPLANPIRPVRLPYHSDEGWRAALNLGMLRLPSVECVCVPALPTLPERLLKASGLGQRRSMTFDALEIDSPEYRRSVDALCSWAREPLGFVLLWGGAGVGKTHLACAAVNEIVRRGREARYVRMGALMRDMRRAMTNADNVWLAYEHVLDAPVLAFDDIEARGVTEWVVQQLTELVMHRYDQELPTLWVSERDMTRQRGPVSSRLLSGLVIQLRGPDRRRKKDNETTNLR